LVKTTVVTKSKGEDYYLLILIPLSVQ